jgi:PKHD-type hydroxylase
MQHVLTPYSRNLESFAWWEGAFSEQELDVLQSQAIKANEEAMVGGGEHGRVADHIRRSELNWLQKTQESAWVYERLAHVVSSLNADYFNFDLTGFGEPLQLTNYHENREGMYAWHQDFGGNGASRKLSIVMQLTDPSAYEGGNLEIMKSKEPFAMKKQRGLIVAFPSWTVHQVTPVTKGTRQSLVGWISGPNFK